MTRRTPVSVIGSDVIDHVRDLQREIAGRPPATVQTHRTPTAMRRPAVSAGVIGARASQRRQRVAVHLACVGVAVLLTALVLPVPARAQTTQVVEYYHTDALGSVRAVTNQQGQVIRRHDFLPFGEELQPTVPPPDKPIFTGKERDAETGLDYFGARYQRAGVGRFTAVDPLMTIDKNLVDPQRWNRYAYAKNNPLRFVDPDGRSSVTFNGETNTFYFYDKDGKLAGSWRASNQVDWRKTTIGKIVDGIYYFEDKVSTRGAGGDHDSSLGPDGMFALKPYMGADGKNARCCGNPCWAVGQGRLDLLDARLHSDGRRSDR